MSKWPIRTKLLIGLGLLLVLVAVLASSGLHAVYAYRGLAKSLSRRVGELPLATVLSQRVGDLRMALGEIHGERPTTAVESRFAREEFRVSVEAVHAALGRYRTELANNDDKGGPIGDGEREWETVHQIETTLSQIDKICAEDGDWVLEPQEFTALRDELQSLDQLVALLPSYLHQSLRGMASDIRNQYRTLITLVGVSGVAAALLLSILVQLFYRWIFRPLKVLIRASRKVAEGNFEYHIKLESLDEMAELADAMNKMTARFRDVRDDLDSQVQERTKQVVRSERLASVGFLAAGVAHEINNPLASIAMCAESLEGRLSGVSLADERDGKIVTQYLQMIQSEAFRCKEITEKLLDFSRMGESQKLPTDLRELVQGVIDMISHLGKYRDRKVELVAGAPIVAAVNAQEMKQVVLNLISNGLDSLEAGGAVWVDLTQEGDHVVITFTDNGCGMSSEVQEHLFEPFFTRRRGGQGTGLGLSITYRIVADHNGQIDAHSDGPGLGSQFRVVLPLVAGQKEDSHRYQAAA